MGDGLTLSHHVDLPVRRESIGWVVGDRLLDGAAGRFATVSEGRLSLDASGSLGVYHGEGDDGPIATSSPALARMLCGARRDERRLSWGRMNWYPAPGSPSVGVSRLLRDQSLRLADGRVFAAPRMIAPMASTAVAIDRLAAHLVDSMRALPDGDLKLALTAGLDSRLLLAALLESGRPFETFTFAVTEKSATDIRIAGELSRRYGIRHAVIEPRAPDRSRIGLYDAHTDAAVFGACRAALLPRGQYDWVRSSDILIGGSGFEVGRRIYQPLMGRLGPESLGPDHLMKARGTTREGNESAYRAIDAWLTWRRAHPDGLDLLDSFFLDQRVGVWMSSTLQGRDGLPCRVAEPGNSDVVFSAVISSDDPAARAEGRIQKAAAKRLCGDILAIPLNPETFGEKAATFLRKGRKKAARAMALGVSHARRSIRV